VPEVTSRAVSYGYAFQHSLTQTVLHSLFNIYHIYILVVQQVAVYQRMRVCGVFFSLNSDVLVILEMQWFDSVQNHSENAN